MSLMYILISVLYLHTNCETNKLSSTQLKNKQQQNSNYKKHIIYPLSLCHKSGNKKQVTKNRNLKYLPLLFWATMKKMITNVLFCESIEKNRVPTASFNNNNSCVILLRTYPPEWMLKAILQISIITLALTQLTKALKAFKEKKSYQETIYYT